MSERLDTRPELSPKDAEVYRASHYPAGYVTRDIVTRMIQRAHVSPAEYEGNYSASVRAQALSVDIRYNRTDADRHHGTPSEVQNSGPVAGRPKPGATAEEIKIWNDRMAAIPTDIRLLYMGLPSWWLRKDEARSAMVIIRSAVD